MSAPLQPPGATCCFQCGGEEVSPLSAYGSPLCAKCLPIGAHVIHHHSGFGGCFAVCDCGWESSADGPSAQRVLQDRGQAHWSEVLASTRAAEARMREGAI